MELYTPPTHPARIKIRHGPHFGQVFCVTLQSARASTSRHGRCTGDSKTRRDQEKWRIAQVSDADSNDNSEVPAVVDPLGQLPIPLLVAKACTKWKFAACGLVTHWQCSPEPKSASNPATGQMLKELRNLSDAANKLVSTLPNTTREASLLRSVQYDLIRRLEILGRFFMFVSFKMAQAGDLVPPSVCESRSRDRFSDSKNRKASQHKSDWKDLEVSFRISIKWSILQTALPSQN